MHWFLKRIGVVGLLCAGGAAAIVFSIYLASESVIERRYPLPATTGSQATSPRSLQRGAHLAQIAGCGDCHGVDFEGRQLESHSGFALWSSNLRNEAADMSDGEFERAIRRGIAPDATSLWEMPSSAYLYMSETDVGAILSYLKSLGRAGTQRHQSHWSLGERFDLLAARIIPSAIAVRDAPNSLDLGPRYDGGRYLARIACGECHGTDLNGQTRAPDLDIVSTYTRPQFFDLLRRGIAPPRHFARAMKRLAAMRFHALADYEIMALYDYFEARAHAPAALVERARANELRRRARAAAESRD